MNFNRKKQFQNRNEYIHFFTKTTQGIINKNELIIELARNKEVLDLGCIDHSYHTAIELGKNWLHKGILDVAKSLIGVDILEKDIIELNKLGYNILNKNVENLQLDKIFETIVAGDIIEHVSNIGLFMESVKNHMNNESIFIITTPNPFNIEQAFTAVFDDCIHVHEEHTCWLSPHNFWEIAERADMKITDFYWVETRFYMPVTRKCFQWISKLISEKLMKKRKICRRDFAVILMRK